MILARQLFAELMVYNMFSSARSRVFSLGALIFALCASIIPLPSYAFDWNKLLYLVPVYGPAKLAYDAPGFALSLLKGGTQFTISTIFKVVLAATEWLTAQLVTLVGPLISVHGFISNPAVTAGWTFIQGLANIGFIIGLLFIALATVLRFQTYSIQRILPRLIIVALLLNFSLVLTGVLIDIAQLGTAVIARAMGHLDAVRFIGRDLLLASDSLQFAVLFLADELIKTPELAGWESVVRNLLMLIVSVVFLSGLAMLVIGLVIRYVMLVLLLIVSPVAFLFWIFPNTTPLAEKWWREFLRYVFYAPIALFILLLATRFTTHLLGQPIDGLSDSFLRIVVLTVMFYMAAIVGKNLGGSVGVAALGFATGTGKRLGRLGARGLYATTAPARWVGGVAGGAVKNQARDALGVGKSALRDYAKGNEFLRKYVVPAKRDDKGNLKPGEKSFASNWANENLQPQGRKKQQRDAVAALMTRDLRITSTNVGDRSLAAPLLSNKHVIDGLGTSDDERFNQVRAIVELGSMSQIRSLFKNSDYLRSLDDNQRNELQLTLESKQTENVFVIPPGSPPGTPPVGIPRNVTANVRNKSIEDLINAFAKIDEK